LEKLKNEGNSNQQLDLQLIHLKHRLSASCLELCKTNQNLKDMNIANFLYYVIYGVDLLSPPEKDTYLLSSSTERNARSVLIACSEVCLGQLDYTPSNSDGELMKQVRDVHPLVHDDGDYTLVDLFGGVSAVIEYENC
jgi:hypothetical protein